MHILSDVCHYERRAAEDRSATATDRETDIATGAKAARQILKCEADREAIRAMASMWDNEPDVDQLREMYALLSTDPTRALVELNALANRGSVMSMVYIANAYRNGIGTKIDLLEAEEWYRRATAAGSVLASYELGRSYLGRMEYDRAEEAFLVGTAKNYAPSMHMLAVMHLRGQGMPINPAKARNLLEGAASQGHVFSKRNLGVLLMSGKFGRGQIIRGFLLFLAALKDSLIVVSRDPLNDRLR